MAKRWTNGDSARMMTNKYNETADEVEKLKKSSEGVNQATQEELNKLQKEVEKKLEEVTVEDLGLEKVDNTPDMYKPVSIYQAAAIDNATENMLTSQPVGEVSGPEPGMLAQISVVGTKLVMVTDTALVTQKVNVYVENNRLVMFSTNI